MHWFRWHHGTANDHILRRIAAHSHTSVANVVAVWACVLESASENSPRGILGNWDVADIAFILGIDESVVSEICMKMQGQVLEGQRVINWDKRNPKREDDRPAHSHRTPQNPTIERATPLEERRGEEKRVTTNPPTPPNGGKKSKSALTPTDDDLTILAHYRTHHPRYRQPDDQTLRVLRKALGEYTVGECCTIIDGNHKDAWACQAKKHELTWIFRTPDNMTKYLEAATPVVLVDENHELTEAGRQYFAMAQ